VHLVVFHSGWYRAISMSCVTLPKWHGRGHRFDPDQVHQLTPYKSDSYRKQSPSFP
jgi:hypothetical protein